MTDTSRRDPGARVVDVHAHGVPRELLTALRSAPGSSSLPELGPDRRLRFGVRWTSPAPEALTDVPARLAEMDRTGVDVQVVSPWIELSPDELEPAARAAFLRLLNDGMAELAADHPDRLRALALVDRHDPASAAAELVRTAARPGVVGVELAAGGSAAPLHDPAWDRLWAAASECGSFVLLHPWRAGSPAGISGLRLGDIVDNPAQSTAVVGAMVLASVFDRFPDLRLCVVHGGGFLPYQAGRFDAIARLEGERSPGSVLRRLYYDSLTHSPEALSWLVGFAGSDRVLLGSDFPFATGDPAAVRAVERAPLTAAARAAVLGANACRLLGC
ncbi:amidohydrolase family protein [Pseudonocardia sp. DSM 110487]|uniref:amidohydrolase family protein n=1 Tax=Pseudonocardia sp. DSM 110487 TaxID=2865833 RepID=UPI001C69F84E|nr:amidohydrolase family protein [Pseudonocardia sp. DSM 110487]QYN39832.1 amidohydrolase family protein [Pseudonocardia sp. DSM 110487]